jgi:cytidylate kinase
VAERLGYRCISREVILEAARGCGISEEELSAAMEKPPSFWERLAGQRSAYLVLVQANLCEQARGGDIVFHGHVGHLLLPGISHVIHVRVIADMEFRIQAVMQRRHLWRHEALAYIEKVDRERRQWVRFLFDVDWEDPRLYDLVLNLSRVRIAIAVETVAQLTQRDEFKPTAESPKAMWDLVLTSRVPAVLATDPRTKGSALRVVAADGLVTITGATHWPEVEEAVHTLVCRVEGVKEVRAEIGILPISFGPSS